MRRSLEAGGRRAGLLAAALAALPLTACSLMATSPPQTTLARTDKAIALQARSVWAPLTDAGTSTLLTRSALEKTLAAGRVTLVLNEISAEEQPGSPYSIYVGLAPDAEPVKNDPHYVGRFSFFNEINHGSLKATPSQRTFDVTAVLQRLRAAGALDGPIGITLTPDRQPEGTVRATIGNIELRRQD
jgi:hypothetical protein